MIDWIDEERRRRLRLRLDRERELRGSRRRADDLAHKQLGDELGAMAERFVAGGQPLPDPATMSIAERLAVVDLRAEPERSAELAALNAWFEERLGVFAGLIT